VQRKAAPAQQEIEVQIGPHPARPNWRLMRVAYVVRPDHDARVTAALDALFGPRPPQGSEPDRSGPATPQPADILSPTSGSER